MDKFILFYQQFGKGSIQDLKQVYEEDVVFQDPIHRIEGLAQLENYFTRLMKQVVRCDFDIKDTVKGQNTGMVIWEMTFAHPRLNAGQAIIVEGSSHLKWENKIHYHRDYFDMGQMLYLHIPVLKQVIGGLNRRMAQ